MTKVLNLTLVFAIGLLSIPGLAQEIEVYRAEQMHADLEKFKTALIQIHPGTYTHQSPQEFERFVDLLKQETSKPMEATVFYKIVLKLIAGIHDGHTQAYTVGKLGGLINNQKQLPFQVYVKDERIFIIRNMSEHEIPEGSEILAIDGNLSNEILQEILRHYSSDGKSGNGMYHWLGSPYRPFYRIFPEVYGARSSYNLVYRDYKSKKIVETEIDAISKELYRKKDSTKYTSKQMPDDAFDFKINKKEDYAYMKISRFIKDGFDEPENTYQDFYKRCFEEISDKNIQNLIIDLRDNGGGKASNAAYLLQYFIDEPITPAKEISTLGNDSDFLRLTGDTLNLNGLSRINDGKFKVTRNDVLRDLMDYHPIKEHNYTGSLVVLIDGGTTSAAGVAAGLLKKYTSATFVGSETYGYAGISNGVRQISIKGNHTATAIYLPLLHAEYSMDEHVRKRSVVPDYHITNSVQDVLNNNDAVMDFVIEKLLPRK